ncbi:MAG: DUF1802 family protein [Vicinamibacteria bacterium]
MSAKTETPKVESDSTAQPEEYVSNQLAVKTWSVIARFLHEGGGIVTLHKAWDTRSPEFLVFPSYSGQDPDAMKPDVWMAWRHELKAPLGGHTYIRDYAEVVEAIPLQSSGALKTLDPEHPLTQVEAVKRYESGKPGLVALVLRVYHLPSSYKFYNVAEKEGVSEVVPLPFDVDLENLKPAVSDSDFERRRAKILSSLGRVQLFLSESIRSEPSRLE